MLMVLLGVGMLFEGVLNLYFALYAVRILRKGQPEVVEYWMQTDPNQHPSQYSNQDPNQ